MPRSTKKMSGVDTTAEAIAGTRANACVNTLEALVRARMATTRSLPPPPPPPVYSDRAKATLAAIKGFGMRDYEKKIYDVFQAAMTAENPSDPLPPWEEKKGRDKTTWPVYGECLVLLQRTQSHNYPLNLPIVFGVCAEMGEGLALTPMGGVGNHPPYSGARDEEWRCATEEEVDTYFAMLDGHVTQYGVGDIVEAFTRWTSQHAGEKP